MSYTDLVFPAYRRRLATLEASNNPLARGVAWIEGRQVPIHEARIPILDQGFLRSDLTYDVPAVWDGRFFRLDDHLDRLERSCARLRLRSPLDRAAMRDTLVAMVAASGIRDAFVEIIVTRGQRYIRQHSPEECENALYLMVLPYVWVMDEATQRQGGRAVVARDVRRVPPGAVDPTVKNLQWGDFTRGLLEARDRDAVYPILTDGDGNLTEGAGYNVVVVKGRNLVTPRKGVLEGVTRKTVLELAQARGYACRLDEVPVSAVYDCDELLFVTTAGGVMPVTRLDGAPVGKGEVGPVGRELWQAYWEAHYDPQLSFAIDYAA